MGYDQLPKWAQDDINDPNRVRRVKASPSPSPTPTSPWMWMKNLVGSEPEINPQNLNETEAQKFERSLKRGTNR